MVEPVQVMEPNRMKTLSLKILTSYWMSDYSQAQKIAYLPPDKLPPNFQINMSSCLARKQVADSVRVLIENRQDCGEDIFLPLLSIRCQKEIAEFEQKLSTQDNSLDDDYYKAMTGAWKHILKLIQ